MNVIWTGQRMRNAGLLYANYDNLAHVTDDEGAHAGTVLKQGAKFNARTRSSVDMGNFDTEADAVAAIARGNRGDY